MTNKTALESVLHYVDDYLFIGAPASDQCQRLLSTMREICAELGVPRASEKEVGPITRLIFLGIMLDSVAQTLSLPAGKSQEILDLLRLWSFKS